MQQVSLAPPESSTQTASRSLQPLLQGSPGDRPTDRPTDHAIYTFFNDRRSAQWEAKYCYCLQLQQVFIVAVDSTYRINFSSQQLYSAVRSDGIDWRVAVYVERQYNITSKRAFPTGVLDRWQCFIYAYFNVNVLNVNYLLKIKNVK